MNVIYKYELKIEDAGVITTPLDSTLLKIAEQDGKLFAWLMVDTTEDNTEMHFRIYGTGHEIDDCCCGFTDYNYFDSILMSNGLVWHVFVEM